MNIAIVSIDWEVEIRDESNVSDLRWVHVGMKHKFISIWQPVHLFGICSNGIANENYCYQRAHVWSGEANAHWHTIFVHFLLYIEREVHTCDDTNISSW